MNLATRFSRALAAGPITVSASLIQAGGNTPRQRLIIGFAINQVIDFLKDGRPGHGAAELRQRLGGRQVRMVVEIQCVLPIQVC
ncbi:hypothetical protein [Pseudomonas sp. StFLB209]|uniref:hypothetical protein n=1 Tax=Pseudomonas sp. StFLB209 TaxID=1028989 RepID=UPI0005EDB91B|nr:hypothetical protein [Pseudomonas sp. StFLB209]